MPLMLFLLKLLLEDSSTSPPDGVTVALAVGLTAGGGVCSPVVWGGIIISIVVGFGGMFDVPVSVEVVGRVFVTMYVHGTLSICVHLLDGDSNIVLLLVPLLLLLLFFVVRDGLVTVSLVVLYILMLVWIIVTSVGVYEIFFTFARITHNDGFWPCLLV